MIVLLLAVTVTAVIKKQGPVGVESDTGSTFDVNCDQQSHGGGWMLAYAYNHLAGEDISLNANTIPTDPDKGYSHILLQSLGYAVEEIESVRFFCRTSGHDRVIHFQTDALASRRLSTGIVTLLPPRIGTT